MAEAAGRDNEWIRPTQAGKLCGGIDRKTLHAHAKRVGVRTMRLGTVTLSDGTIRQGEQRYNAADIDVLAERFRLGDTDGRIVNGQWVPNV